MSKITAKVVIQQLLAYLTEYKFICPFQSAYRPHNSTETALFKITTDILLHLTPAMFLFWHSWIFQLLLTQLTIAYFVAECNTCMASQVLHSPGFLLIWQIEHSQSSSMTTSHKSQALPMVCHRVLCWAQFSSSSTQNLFLTWLVSLHWVSIFRGRYSVLSLCPSIENSICNIFSGNLSVRHPDLDAGKQT